MIFKKDVSYNDCFLSQNSISKNQLEDKIEKIKGDSAPLLFL